MKKMSFLVSLFVLSALVLAACGGANNGNNAPGTGAQTTPGAGEVVGTPDPNVTVPTEPAGAVATEPVVPTEPLVPTEPAVVEPTATVAAGDVTVTQTPEANMPVTGDAAAECRVDNLENLLDFTIVNQNGDEVGEVGGLLISRSLMVLDDDALEATGEAGGDMTPAPQATETVPPAPGAENPPVAGEAQTGAQASNAMVQYLVIDVDEAGTEALIPYQAFNFGEMVPEQQDDAIDDDCVLILNVSQEALANLPDFDPNNIDFTVDTWDEEFRVYWTDQGLVIPDTEPAGEGMLNQTAFIDDDWIDINARNTNGDDLGEVSTFITIPQTGEFQYAILAAGGFLGLGERYIPVPMNIVQWAQDDDDTDDLNELGYLVIPIADDAWENAPAFDAVNEIDTTVEGWDEEIETFWNNLDGNPND